MNTHVAPILMARTLPLTPHTKHQHDFTEGETKLTSEHMLRKLHIAHSFDRFHLERFRQGQSKTLQVHLPPILQGAVPSVDLRRVVKLSRRPLDFRNNVTLSPVTGCRLCMSPLNFKNLNDIASRFARPAPT